VAIKISITPTQKPLDSAEKREDGALWRNTISE
jgi:hypothetical protein